METKINGLNMFYTDQGDAKAPCMVFIHGFPFSHAMWDGQVERFQKQYRIITYDLRGHGASDAGDGQFPLEFLVDDLVGLLDYLKIPRAIICGLSLGGYIALRAIERESGRFQALVLCDTRSEADSNEAKLKRSADMKVVKSDVAAFTENFLKAVFTPGGLAQQPESVDRIRRMILKSPPLGMGGTLLALASRTDTTSSLSAIRVPTLILVGDQDKLTPPAAAQSMKEKIPNSALFVIPSAGHLSNVENPNEFNQRLSDFLSSLPRP